MTTECLQVTYKLTAVRTPNGEAWLLTRSSGGAAVRLALVENSSGVMNVRDFDDLMSTAMRDLSQTLVTAVGIADRLW